MPETASKGRAAKALPLCPGYSDIAGTAESPKVSFDGSRVTSVEAGGARIANPELLANVGSWTLMAVIERDGAPLSVFEQIAVQTGDIAFVGAKGLVRRASKSLEPTTEGEAGLKFHGIDAWYRGHRKEDVLPDHRDVMREELLAGGRDPGPFRHKMAVF